MWLWPIIFVEIVASFPEKGRALGAYVGGERGQIVGNFTC